MNAQLIAPRVILWFNAHFVWNQTYYIMAFVLISVPQQVQS